MIKTFTCIALLFNLSGCAAALPPALVYLGYIKTGADCISYLTTHKSTSDHLVSAVLHEDCAAHRVFLHEKICHENNDSTTIAMMKAHALSVEPAAGNPN